MKEYKFVKANQGIKAIQFGANAVTLEDNCNKLIEQYSAEGWKVFQFTTSLGEVNQIIFEKDK